MHLPTLRPSAALVALTLAAALPSAHAADVTLDFSGSICGAAGNLACANYSEIGQSYGDIAGILDVSYRSVLAATGATYEPFLKYWSTSYSDLTGVAWGGGEQSSYYSEITFVAAAGQQVTVDGLDFGDYQNRNFGSMVSIFDLGGTLLWNGGSFDPGLTATHFDPSVSSTTGLVLRWGADGYDVGADNIRLTVGSVIAAPVPEPETYALMLAGLGLTGWLGRRRSAKR